MTNKPLPTLPEFVEHSTGASLTSAALLLASHLPPGSREQALALVTIYGPIVNTTIGRAVRWVFTERIVPFIDNFVRPHGAVASSAEAHAKFEEVGNSNEDNPTFHRTVYESFRRMMDATDGSVVPALGSLGGLYTSEGKKPDAFFRGLGRLLCDLEAGELDDLAILLRKVEAMNVGEDRTWLDVVHDWSEDDKPILELAFSASQGKRLPGVDSAPRLFMLLKRETLARNKSARYEDERRFESGDQAMWMSAEMLQQILHVIDPQGEVKARVMATLPAAEP